MVNIVQICYLRVRNFLITLKNVLKTSSKRFIQKKGESTGGLVGIKIANKITKVSKNYK